MKLYVTCKKSNKSDSVYYALVLDVGYRKIPLNFSRDVCAEVLGIPVRDLASMSIGEEKIVPVGK